MTWSIRNLYIKKYARVINMIERLVNLRRKIRNFKNTVRGRTLEKSETLDTKFSDALFPYLTGGNIHIFGVDTEGRLHIFDTYRYEDILRQNQTIEDLGFEQMDIHYQKFSGNRDIRHYVDANYENNGCKLRIMAKIGEDIPYNNN